MTNNLHCFAHFCFQIVVVMCYRLLNTNSGITALQCAVHFFIRLRIALNSEFTWGYDHLQLRLLVLKKIIKIIIILVIVVLFEIKNI